MNDTSPRFDRQVRAWLDLMPSEAPDRVVANVLQATETAPQARPPLAVALRRPLPMNRLSLVATAAVAVLAVVAGAALLSRPSTNVGATASPSAPSATTTVAPASAPLPATLVGRWFGQGRGLPTGSAGAGAAMLLDPNTVSLSPSNHQDRHLSSADAGVAGDELRVRSSSDDPSGGPCRAGDAGTYAWQVSASQQTLTLTLKHDDCAVRGSALAGTWWRVDCKNAGGDVCLGWMDPGTYASQYVRPMLGSAAWEPLFGGLTFTVPYGWANDEDWPTIFGLVPLDQYQAAAPKTDSYASRIEVWTQVRAESQATPCSGKVDPSVQPGAANFVYWLAHVKGLVVGKSTGFTIDGLNAVAVDVSVDPKTAPKCGDPDPLVEFQLSGTEGQALGGPHPAPTRLIFVDMPNGELVSIWIEVSDPAQLAPFAAQAMPIIETFGFNGSAGG